MTAVPDLKTNIDHVFQHILKNTDHQGLTVSLLKHKWQYMNYTVHYECSKELFACKYNTYSLQFECYALAAYFEEFKRVKHPFK